MFDVSPADLFLQAFFSLNSLFSARKKQKKIVYQPNIEYHKQFMNLAQIKFGSESDCFAHSDN